LGDDYDQPGPNAVNVTPGSMLVLPNCDLDYEIYEPDTLDSEVPVFLAHGFMRSIDDMAEVAEHIASWGVKVYAVPLCTNSFSIDHELNGQAIAALADALEPNAAVYAGFSAGGLAAFVAAAEASNTVAYVGLDAVDSNGIGLGVVGQLDAPARGSIAEPGQCNTNNNFLPVYDQIGAAPVIKIIGAQHFDFETAACGGGDFACSFCAPAGPQTHSLALGMTTAGILIETGADLGGNSWWDPSGAYFQMFVDQGRILLLP
jgi:pimeloyl-ACP methyl ester carboxylesterase